VTRPEGIFVGLAIVLFGMLAGVVVFATGIIMAIRLNNLRNTSSEADEMLQERRRIVTPSLVIIGVAAALCAILLVLDIWWNIGSGFPFNRMFRVGH
jgi:hypothetical protein